MHTYKFIILAFLLSLTVSCKKGYKINDENVTYSYWNEAEGSVTFNVEGADPKTFKIHNDFPEFGSDKNSGFYKGYVIDSSEGRTFVPLTMLYSKDKNKVFYGTRLIRGAESSSFSVIENGPFGIDRTHYFYYWRPIEAVDVTTFKILNDFNAVDKNHYYSLGISSDDSVHIQAYPIKDHKSFRLLENGYSRDKYQVYFNGEVVKHADPETFQTHDYARGHDNTHHFYGRALIKQPNELRNLEYDYLTDREDVFFNFDIIENVDILSFHVISQNWAKDKNCIYFEGKKLDSVDLKSFQHLRGLYARDKKFVYYGSKIISSEPRSAESVGEWGWIKDKEAFYFEGTKMLGIDYASFQVLANDYAKDKFNVYFRTLKVRNADVKSFRTTSFTYGGEDKFGSYYMGKRE